MKLGGHIKKDGKDLISTCNTCGKVVNLSEDTKDWFGSGYFCPSCNNKLAVELDGDIVDVESLLKLNPSIPEKAEKINKTLHSVLGVTDKDWEIFMALNYLAANDKTIECPFHIVDSDEKDETSTLLLFDKQRKIYVGFLDWATNEGEYGTDYRGSDVLFHIYILEDERNKGYGTEAMNYWVENHAKKVNGKFGIELPPKSQLKNVLINLGHAKEVDGKFVPINFYETLNF